MASETDCPDAGPPAETRRNVLKGSVAGLAAGLFATSQPALGQNPATARALDSPSPRSTAPTNSSRCRSDHRA